MRGLDGIIRLRKWQLDEVRRALADLEKMRADLIADLDQLANEVDREQTVAADDPATANYGAYARGVIDRRDTLRRSIGEVDQAIKAKRDDVTEAFRELKKYEIAAARAHERDMVAADRREQAEGDEVGLQIYRRRNRGG